MCSKFCSLWILGPFSCPIFNDLFLFTCLPLHLGWRYRLIAKHKVINYWKSYKNGQRCPAKSPFLLNKLTGIVKLIEWWFMEFCQQSLLHYNNQIAIYFMYKRQQGQSVITCLGTERDDKYLVSFICSITRWVCRNCLKDLILFKTILQIANFHWQISFISPLATRPGEETPIFFIFNKTHTHSNMATLWIVILLQWLSNILCND